MRRGRSLGILLCLVALWLAAGLPPAVANDNAGLLTAPDIERKRAELDEATGLSAEVREQVAEQFTKAAERLEAAGIHAMLVGESLLKQSDPGAAAAVLLGR